MSSSESETAVHVIFALEKSLVFADVHKHLNYIPLMWEQTTKVNPDSPYVCRKTCIARLEG